MYGQREKVTEQEKSGGIKSYEWLSVFFFFLFLSCLSKWGFLVSCLSQTTLRYCTSTCMGSGHVYGQRGRVTEQEKSGGIKSYEGLSAFSLSRFFG